MDAVNSSFRRVRNYFIDCNVPYLLNQLNVECGRSRKEYSEPRQLALYSSQSDTLKGQKPIVNLSTCTGTV